jgi:hypothetical protein
MIGEDVLISFTVIASTIVLAKHTFTVLVSGWLECELRGVSQHTIGKSSREITCSVGNFRWTYRRSLTTDTKKYYVCIMRSAEGLFGYTQVDTNVTMKNTCSIGIFRLLKYSSSNKGQTLHTARDE